MLCCKNRISVEVRPDVETVCICVSAQSIWRA
jgi:hypothetical protein